MMQPGVVLFNGKRSRKGGGRERDGLKREKE